MLLGKLLEAGRSLWTNILIKRLVKVHHGIALEHAVEVAEAVRFNGRHAGGIGSMDLNQKPGTCRDMRDNGHAIAGIETS